MKQVFLLIRRFENDRNDVLVRMVFFQVPNVIKCYCRNKLECLSLVSFSSLSNKTTSLAQKSVNYGQNEFYNIGSRTESYKTFWVHNSQMFIIS